MEDLDFYHEYEPNSIILLLMMWRHSVGLMSWAGSVGLEIGRFVTAKEKVLCINV